MKVHFPIFSGMMNAATPEGTPPRRIPEKIFQMLPGPPCPGEALRRAMFKKTMDMAGGSDIPVDVSDEFAIRYLS
jgi:hypothetical protein